MTVQQVYDQAVKPLPIAERLRLAAMILNDLPPHAVVDDSEEWTADDIADFQRAGWNHLAQHGINAEQAREMRWRLQAFTEDWDRPEMDVYNDPEPR